MVKLAALALALAGCTYGASFEDCEVSCTDAIGCPDGFSCSTEQVCRPANATGLCFSELGLFPVIVSQDLDVLFVIDNTTTVDAAGVFAAIDQGPWAGTNGLPNLHIGVTSTDLGTRNVEAQTQPAVGSCAGDGNNGVLRTDSGALTGDFISDTSNGDGTRTDNYTGTITSVFDSLAAVGANGCMFQQPLAAVPLAIGAPGFVRPPASLAIVIVSDGDDCSLQTNALFGADTDTLGPATPFRCTRFGVTCDDNGTTPDTMNLAGPKDGCHSSANTDYLAAVSSYVATVSAIKFDPRLILIGSVTGPPTPVAVEVSGGVSEVSACFAGSTTALPAIRTSEFASSFRRSIFASACDSTALAHFADPLAELTGSTCLRAPIAQGTKCVATDETLTTSAVVPPCDATRTTDCYNLLDDATCAEGGTALQVLRTQVPDPTTMTSFRCRN